MTTPPTVTRTPLADLDEAGLAAFLEERAAGVLRAQGPGPGPRPDPREAGQRPAGPRRPAHQTAEHDEGPGRRGRAQLRRPRGAGRAARDLRRAALGGDRPGRLRGQLQPHPHVGRAGLPHAVRCSGVAPALVAGGEGPVRLSRPGLRPALLDAGRARHRDGHRADERRRPRRPVGRGAGPRRPERQGDLGGPDLRQPVRRRLLPGGRRRAGVDVHRRARLPDLLGQRLRVPPPHRGRGQERGRAHPGRRLGPSRTGR